jgi:hypothetical protein
MFLAESLPLGYCTTRSGRAGGGDSGKEHSYIGVLSTARWVWAPGATAAYGSGGSSRLLRPVRQEYRD